MKKIFVILGIMFMCGVSMGVTFFIDVYAAEINEIIPELYIKAVNPGYVVDGINNVGEMIEIGRRDSDALTSLAGITVGYTNSSGNYSTLFEFPENSFLNGETFLLRLASSPESELAAENYTKTLAFKASLSLQKGDDVLDEICWTSKEGCYKEFKSANPTTLVRNLETGGFEHISDYNPVYHEDNYYVEKSEEDGLGRVESQCKGLVISEILSYYDTSKTEQFVEIYNSAAEQILMDGCAIKYKNKVYTISGVLPPEKYYVYYPVEFSLTKNPTNKNIIQLIDIDGGIVDTLEYPNGQRRGASYALIGYDEKGKTIFRVTYAVTPGEPNIYQEFKTCEEGKVINEATGNCVKVASVTEKVCKEGQYLNILTGRCKKIEAVTEKTCKEGYYLNEATGRCKKIVENTGANYSLEPESYEEKSSFVALYAVLGVVGLGAVYLIYEFRREIGKLFGKVFRRFR